MIGVIGVIVAILLVMVLAYRGWGIIPASLICSLVVIITNSRNLWEALSVDYVEGFTYFAGSFFLIFVLGSLFGKVMGDSGAATAISYKLINVFGSSKAARTSKTVLPKKPKIPPLLYFLFSMITASGPRSALT